MTDLVLPEDGRTLSVAEVEAWCGQIEQAVADAEDLWFVEDLRKRFDPFAAAYTKATKDGAGTIQATARRMEQRVGELIVAARERGELAEQGRPEKVEPSTFSTLADLGIAKEDAAEFVAMAQHPEAVAEAIAESDDEHPATRNKVRTKVRAERRQQSREHPAKFSRAIIAGVVELLEQLPVRRILDPFAGTGLVHEIAERLGADSIGVELEPEWASLHDRTICADSRFLIREMVGDFDAVVTSPTYANRMADHHEAADDSDRATYRHRLGRPLSDGNSGGMQWGNEYRDLHVAVYQRVVDLLAPGGVFVLNVKDHVRDGRRVPVSGWHVATLLGLGLYFVDDNAVATRGLAGGAGDNADAREGIEHVYLFEKPWGMQ